MTNAISIHKDRGLILSVMHRFLLIVYATTMICPQRSLSQDAFFCLLIVSYIMVVCVFRGHGIWKNLLRMVSDVGFIYYVLVQYNAWDFRAHVFIIIPLFCKAVLSDENFSSFLYVAIPVMMILLFRLDFKMVVSPFVILFVIDLIGRAKHFILKTASELDDIIDEFFVSDKNTSKSFNIYKNAIPLLNKFPIYAGIQTIFCIRYTDADFQLINGSRFVYKYQIRNPECLVHFIKKGQDGEVNNVVVDVDGILTMVQEVYPVKVGSETYLFMLTFKEKAVKNLNNRKLLFPRFFARMANVVHAERKRKEIEDETMRNLSVKVNYVEAATDTMHFIRNKLSPVSTYISMMDDFDKADEAKRTRIQPYLDKTFQKIVLAYDMIVRRANILLEESNSPFDYTATLPFGIQKLYSEIRTHWQCYDLSESSIDVKLLETNKVKGERKYIYYNSDGMFLVLDNWIHNMKKHGGGDYSLTIAETVSNYSLVFENNFGAESDLDFVKLYSSSDKNEILKRKWHGLQVVKDALAQMNIQNTMTMDKNRVKFRITLAKITKYEENSNH